MKNNINNLLLNIIIVLFAIFPIIPEKIKGLPVVLLVLITIYYIWKKEQINFKLFIILSIYFISNLLSVFYNNPHVFPLNKIETSLSLLIIPFFFSISKSQYYFFKKNKFFFEKLFIISSSILALTSLIYFNYLNLFSEKLKVNSFRDAILEIPFIYGHPIYISIYFSISILLIINRIKKIKLNIVNVIFYCIAFFILSFNLVLLSSKAVLISLILAIIYYLINLINTKSYQILIILSTLSIFFLIIHFSPTSERRFREFTKKTTLTRFDVNNSTSIRISIYKSTLSTIKKAPFLGFGWGLADEELYKCFKEKNKYLYTKKYNTHNQYLSTVLNGGVLNLSFFLFFLLSIFMMAFKNKDYLFSSIIIFYSVLFLAENILERQSGLILFIFIISYFYYLNKNRIGVIS